MNKMLRFSVVTSIIPALFAAQGIQAQVYKWTDENGKLHFTDKPPKQSQKEPEEVKLKPKQNTSKTRFSTIAQHEPIKKLVIRFPDPVTRVLCPESFIDHEATPTRTVAGRIVHLSAGTV